jgi:hypothetical protein
MTYSVVFQKYLSGFFSILALLISGLASAQPDTSYVKIYRNNLVPRMMTNYKNQVTNFVTKSDTSFSADYFSTGAQNFMGAEVSYKWATLGYSFGFNRENSSANMDFRFSTAYKPFRFSANVTSLKNLNYYRVSGLDSLDTVFIARQKGISLRNVGLKVDYILNNKKFYYSPSVSQVGRQLKSQGSFIISSGISFQDFDLRGLSDSASFNFHQLYDANRFKTIRADLGAGYAYNWVLGKKVVIYISETPNIGVQTIYFSGNQEQGRRHTTVSLTNYFRAGVVFTWKNKFLGAYAYNAVTTGKWSGFNYNDVYTSLQLHFGMVLNAPKFLSGRKTIV